MSSKSRRHLLSLSLCLAFLSGAAVIFLTAFNVAGSGDTPEYTLTSLPQAPGGGRAFLSELSDVFETASGKISPSVVPIFAEATVEVQSPFGAPNDSLRQFFGDDFFKQFFGPQGEQKETVHSLGSGVIISSDGYILTNNHVVHGAQKLTVVLDDKSKHEARVVGTDPPTDIAVIKIARTGLPASTLGDSDQVQIGQWVIAVGNPFQLMHTVTAGIISAKGRSSVGLAEFEDFFQTDASINPGNSGGALADLDGNVIGINTAISSPSGGNVGIGFAVPINMARTVKDELIAHGKVTRGYLGAALQTVDATLAKALNLPVTHGVIVADVTPSGPANRAGIERGDVLVEFAGSQVTDTVQIRNMVAGSKPGTSVPITLLRNGRRMEVTVVLQELPVQMAGRAPQSAQEAPQGESPGLGLVVQDLTPQIAEQLGYKGAHGVVVADVVPGSPAEDAGMARGDLIEQVNRTPVSTTQDLIRATDALRSGDAVAFVVRRGSDTFFVSLQVP